MTSIRNIQGALSISFLVFALSASAESVFKYDPALVSLTGILDSRIYAGPPNYESVKQGDRPNEIWLMSLSHPVSMEEDKNPASFNEKEIGIKEIHLIFKEGKSKQGWENCRRAAITVSGKLFHAHTIHHPLPVLMDVENYTLCKEGRND